MNFFYTLIDGFLNSFNKDYDHFPKKCNNPLCLNGLLPDGMRFVGEGTKEERESEYYITEIEKYKLCPICNDLKELANSKVNAFVEINETFKAKMVVWKKEGKHLKKESTNTTPWDYRKK